MKKDTILIGIIALLVGGIFGYCVGQAADWHDGDRYGYEKYDRSDDRRGLEADDWEYGGMGMMGAWDDEVDHSMHMGMMDMTVSSEKEFLAGMIPHHQEAVDTAKEVLARGATTPEIKALVENIIVAQEREIAEMKEWHQNWYGEAYQDNGSYHEMMRELEGLSGEAIDRAFLSDMIMHHMGAIMMARSVEPHIEHDEIKNLTANIITTQSEEINEMRIMLRGL
ncbi:DUF305 domain-containing protein [Candidatus Nomurabacteria bacterium]|nr:DUF305 domain-containing protein [Candidatus Nomurabacteria bacterium]